MIDAHTHLENGDLSVEYVCKFIDAAIKLSMLYYRKSVYIYIYIYSSSLNSYSWDKIKGNIQNLAMANIAFYLFTNSKSFNFQITIYRQETLIQFPAFFYSYHPESIVLHMFDTEFPKILPIPLDQVPFFY